jgi:peptidylprolyl isomerase
MGKYRQCAHIYYEGSRVDGEVFDSNAGEEPLSFVIGNAEVFPKIENAVMGMSIGEKRTVFIPREDAYGPVRQELIQEIPLYALPNGFLLEEGMTIRLAGNNASYPPIAQVVRIKSGKACLDLNHPLAGEDLVYTITLVGLEDG